MQRSGIGKMFDRLKSGLWGWLPGTMSNGLTTVGLFAMILVTSGPVDSIEERIYFGVMVVVWGCIALELLFHLRLAFTMAGRYAGLATPEGLIDLAAAIIPPIGWVLENDLRDASLFSVVWTLRYIRHSTGLPLFWRIFQRSRTALLSIASLFLVVFLGTATLAYVFERDIQPEAFGSISRAMWWSIVTLTTTGYGDVVPTTVWGRLLGGWLMIGGIVTFALQAGIIATAFSEELQRRHFLRTWDLVMSVSFFQRLSTAAVADIVKLLHTRHVTMGTTIVRSGDPGNTMYFIVSGEAAVQLRGEPVILGPGNFFGEMALLFGSPRSANVVAVKPMVLLVLDIADFRQLAGRWPEIVDAIEIEGKRRRQENVVMARD